MATASLIATGCVMLRKCHLNTCSVGIATQDPRAARAVTRASPRTSSRTSRSSPRACAAARAARRALARRDRRRVELPAAARPPITRRRAMLDLRRDRRAGRAGRRAAAVRHGAAVDARRSRRSRADRAAPSRARGRTLGRADAADRQHAAAPSARCCPARSRSGTARSGLPDGSIRVRFTGSAGQSFGAFLAPGVTLELSGDANDYIGKGMSGGRIVVYPPASARFAPEDNVIIGNVALYGATAGDLFAYGLAGERFAVRNSGARAVVEGVGDHGCEYMTGGVVVVLGPVGRNFAAGMSRRHRVRLRSDAARCARRRNLEMVELESLVDESDLWLVYGLIEDHVRFTGSPLGRRVLDNWEHLVARFVKVMPTDYKRVLQARRAASRAAPGPARDRRRRQLMGKPTGFIEWPRAAAARSAPVAERLRDWREVEARARSARGRRAPAPGRALHGLRRAVLHAGLPARQPDPRLRATWCTRALARRASPSSPRPTTSPSSPAGCARRRARPRACSASTTRRSRSRRSRRRSPSARSPRAGSRRAAAQRAPASASRSSARAPRASPPRPSSTAPATRVIVYEAAARAGGLLRYGIPDFKMEKRVIDRRLAILEAEGIEIRCGVAVGRDPTWTQLRADHDALVIAIGAQRARDLAVPGRELAGVVLAMDYLTEQNQVVGGERRAHAALRRRAASASSSSAAATPARTASAPRSARAPRRSRRSS